MCDAKNSLAEKMSFHRLGPLLIRVPFNQSFEFCLQGASLVKPSSTFTCQHQIEGGAAVKLIQFAVIGMFGSSGFEFIAHERSERLIIHGHFAHQFDEDRAPEILCLDWARR